MTVRTITPQEVDRLARQGKAPQIIDVRTPAEYAAVHVEGARSVPLDELDAPSLKAAGQGPPDAPIYFICGSGSRSAKACEKLASAGWEQVFSIAGGTTAWQGAGLPIVRGPGGTISLERQVRIAAGGLVLVGVMLGWLVHPALLALAGFVGAGLVFAGVTDSCGMALLLSRMPWNRAAHPATCSLSPSPPASRHPVQSAATPRA